jgi:hypothetical protein
MLPRRLLLMLVCFCAIHAPMPARASQIFVQSFTKEYAVIDDGKSYMPLGWRKWEGEDESDDAMEALGYRRTTFLYKMEVAIALPILLGIFVKITRRVMKKEKR